MTSTPPAWRWLDECEVPAQVYQHMTSETPGGAGLSIHSHKLPESDAFRERNDSATEPEMSSFTTRKLDKDPTGEDIWPLERECDCTAQIADAQSCAAPEHRVGTCYLDPDTGETVMPPDFFGEKELRWAPDKTTAPETTSPADGCSVESCPECGAVTDIDYGAVMDRGVDMNEEPAVEVADREETFSVPFKTQEWIFESLVEEMVAELPHVIFTHSERIIEMARDRFRAGYAQYGSAMYSWSPERRLDETLQELADAVVYPTSGPIG